ncbi:hypothetical protein [Actinomadura montaniterrae]|uniref:Intracellular growth attenuator family protein n=1 Tax=Actinomadura montaniterrae TaxID=1803903 RepID=A0A6L3VXK5_9ACTN|nr:hypothetical protein [Actinomadura montaniterrae]KAB2384654.1 intracellular growth attenuator family protein [Actinomadura montaniterrae]
MLVGVIAACEIGFWVVLAAGLAARYPLRMRRTGAALLLGVPLVDLVLLVATVADLRGGATAGFAHGLAAAYLGYSVAFGHSMVRWADERFAHRFAGGPPPRRKPRYGRARARYEWVEFGKAAVATAIGCALLLVMIALVGDADRTAALTGWTARLGLVLAVWSLWPITHTLWPSRPKDGEASRRPAERARPR